MPAIATVDTLRDFIKTQKPNGYTYGILFENEDGSTYLHKVVGAPCLGELRPYKENGDTVTRPSDLRHPWPKEGHPIAVACQVPWMGYLGKDIVDLFFGGEGPWRKAFTKENTEVIYNKVGEIVSVLITDTHIDSDIFVNGLGVSRGLDQTPGLNVFREVGATDNEAFVCSIYTQENLMLKPKAAGVVYWMNHAHPKRVLEGDPITFSKGRTFYDRYAYHRPKIEYIWAEPHHCFDELPQKAEINPKDVLESLRAFVAKYNT